MSGDPECWEMVELACAEACGTDPECVDSCTSDPAGSGVEVARSWEEFDEKFMKGRVVVLCLRG